ncbi:MAG: zinc ribbon domain-containing protein, partial [Microthrixaceae bacterium]
MASLDDLLAVQLLDTRIDQLRHQRAHLPQRAALRSLATELDAANVLVDEAAGRLKALRSSQKEAEDHASLLDDKATEVDGSLYDGSVTSHKELESLQAEHRQLKEHQAQFEDQALELMEQAEPVEAERDELQGAVDALTSRRSELEAELAVGEAELDVQLDSLVAERAAAVAPVPADLVSLYEGLRERLGGVAVAK